jgi:hypothetical protein
VRIDLLSISALPILFVLDLNKTKMTRHANSIKDPSNTSHYTLSEDLIPRPTPDDTYSDIDLEFDCKQLLGSINGRYCSNRVTRGRRAILLV